jgi:hypothetical protein
LKFAEKSGGSKSKRAATRTTGPASDGEERPGFWRRLFSK